MSSYNVGMGTGWMGTGWMGKEKRTLKLVPAEAPLFSFALSLTMRWKYNPNRRQMLGASNLSN
jgi:hypothetical protein